MTERRKPSSNVTYAKGSPECATFCPTDAIQWVRADLETLARKEDDVR